MARPLRIEFEGAWYHTMNRGTSRRAIFLHDDHREMFLRLLAESVAMFGIEIHSYCLAYK
jgi:putative transposase